jgi:hypothetical protein
MPTRDALNIEPAEIDNIIAPPLPNDTTLEIVDPELRIVGYVFSCAGAAGATLEQRWVLYGGASLPLPATLREPEDPARRCTTLAAWQNAVTGGGLWQPGATYVKVHGASYSILVDPETGAPPFPSLRVAKRPQRPEKPLQMVDLEITVVQAEVDLGYVHGTKLAPIGTTGLQGNREYWVTRHAPGASVPISFNKGSAAARSVQAFLDAMFVEGSTLTIASCTYLPALPADP